MARILVIEDDSLMANVIAGWLTIDQHMVDVVNNGEQALEYLQTYEYSLIVMDWQLPGLSGPEICQKYRMNKGMAPVLMLTGLSSSDEKVHGLESGADDYLTKPFDTKELMARVRALLRRQPAFVGEMLEFGTLCLDVKSKTLRVAGKAIQLLPLEFNVVEFMMRHPHDTVTAEVLLHRVWKSEADASLDSVYACMSRMRKKLKVHDKDVIRTVRGQGYQLVPPGE